MANSRLLEMPNCTSPKKAGFGQQPSSFQMEGEPLFVLIQESVLRIRLTFSAM